MSHRYRAQGGCEPAFTGGATASGGQTHKESESELPFMFAPTPSKKLRSAPRGVLPEGQSLLSWAFCPMGPVKKDEVGATMQFSDLATQPTYRIILSCMRESIVLRKVPFLSIAKHWILL